MLRFLERQEDRKMSSHEVWEHKAISLAGSVFAILLGAAFMTFVLSLLLVGVAQAQTVEELDDLREEAERAQEGAMSEAEAFAAHILALARDRQSDASSVLETLNRGEESYGTLSEMFGLSEEDMAGFSQETSEQGPVLYVMISLGMPDVAIRRLVQEAEPLGATVVIRGFYGGSLAETQRRVSEIFVEGDTSGMIIDPRPFQAFNVQHVPTFVVSESPIEPCGGLGCIPAAPPHDLIRGNVSIMAALEAMGRAPE